MKDDLKHKTIQLIRECIKEVKDDETDSEIEGEPLGADDIWAGSDIEGIKAGGTGLPHGSGYPNVKKFNKEYFRQIFNHIHGVPESELNREGNRDKEATYNFIQKNFPWVFTHNYKKEYSNDLIYPFAELFRNNVGGHGWRQWMWDAVNELRGNVVYWKQFPKDELKAGARQNRHWVMRYVNMLRTLKSHPDFIETMDKISKFVNKLSNHSVENPRNSANYPLHVSLYDVTRRLGGHEEGGWWYDSNDAIESIKVNSFRDALRAVKHLLRIIPQADLNGKPDIIIEKESGHLGNKQPPTYS